MSAAETGGDAAGTKDRPPAPPADVSRLHERRRAARRRRHLARVDLGLGLLGALILVVATPGLAITGVIALIVLLLCLLTYALERRRSGRGHASR